MIICICRGKSERDVARAIDDGATSLLDLQRCGIGDQCGSCHNSLRAIRGYCRQVITDALVAEDGQGFIWAGTVGGVARWDGYRVRSFHHSANDPTSLPGDFIQTLHVDPRGRLPLGKVSAQGEWRDQSPPST